MNNSSLNNPYIRKFADYNAAVGIAVSSFTPPCDGIIKMGYLSAGDNTYSGGIQDAETGQDLASQYSAYKYSNGGTFWCEVKGGKTYNITTNQPNKVFVPYK